MRRTAEHERKLEAPPGWRLPDIGGEPLEPRVFTSVYHDTADGSLARAGLTLRRRTERGRSVWQLKLPAGDARLELEEAGGPILPAPLAKLLRAHVRGGGVMPVAELRTRRHGVLVMRSGTRAEATIDEVSVMDAQRVTDEFVEIEVELTEGSAKELDRVARDLCKAGAREGNGLPKLFRVLGRETPALPEAPFERLRALLRRQLATILANDPGTRLGADPDSLHDMRVAVRRSRALLRAARELVASDTQMLTAELKWLGGVLGAVRDLDVLVERLTAEGAALDPDDAAAAHQLVRRLRQRRTRERRAMLKALDGDRYLRLLDRFGEEIEALEPAATAVTLDAIAKRQATKLRRAAAATGRDAADDELHALRKRAKRARYAAELAGRDKSARRAKRAQDVLGEHQDAVVTEETLRTLAAVASAPQALAAGRLIDGERARRASARRAWRKLATLL